MASALLAYGMHPQITWLLGTSGDYLWKEELLNECPRGRHEEAFWAEPSRIGSIYISGCGHPEQGLPHQLLVAFKVHSYMTNPQKKKPTTKQKETCLLIFI